MKRIILIFFLAISQIANSQNSFLTGNILLDDGYPAVGANVYIKELNLGAISDFNGNYNLSNILMVHLMLQFLLLDTNLSQKKLHLKIIIFNLIQFFMLMELT